MDDPYDGNGIFNPQIGGGPIVPEHISSEEEKLYFELIGKYQGTLGSNGTTMENVLWESVNDVFQQLIDKGYKDYSRFLIKPTRLGPRDFVDFGSFRAQLMSALQRMSKDFDFATPTYLIYRDLPNAGPQISANATSSPIQYNDQKNTQDQTQTQNLKNMLTIEERVELIEQALEENLTEEQMVEVKPVLDEYKSEPNKWGKASKLIKVVLGLSRDVAVGIISNIIASQIGVPKI